jgi:hypothetical protein
VNGVLIETVVHQMKETKGSVVTAKCGAVIDTKKEPDARWTSWNEVTCEGCLDQTMARIQARPDDYQKLLDAYKK